jgi:hypothetical protein
MQLVYTLADALAALAAKNLSADATFALLPLVDSFYDEDAQSAAHARKYADVVVAVAVGHAQAFDRPTQRRMAESGVDVFILAPAQNAPVVLNEITPYVNTTHYLQAVVAVMPSIVVVHPNNIPLLKVTRALEKTFPQLFTFMEPSVKLMPTHSAQHDILQALQVVQNMAQSGEGQARALLQAGADALKVRGFGKIHELAFYDAATLVELNDRVGQAAYLFAVVERGGQRYQQVLRVVR